jgi:hypothetical protein
MKLRAMRSERDRDGLLGCSLKGTRPVDRSAVGRPRPGGGVRQRNARARQGEAANARAEYRQGCPRYPHPSSLPSPLPP